MMMSSRCHPINPTSTVLTCLVCVGVGVQSFQISRTLRFQKKKVEHMNITCRATFQGTKIFNLCSDPNYTVQTMVSMKQEYRFTFIFISIVSILGEVIHFLFQEGRPPTPPQQRSKKWRHRSWAQSTINKIKKSTRTIVMYGTTRLIDHHKNDWAASWLSSKLS